MASKPSSHAPFALETHLMIADPIVSSTSLPRPARIHFSFIGKVTTICTVRCGVSRLLKKALAWQLTPLLLRRFWKNYSQTYRRRMTLTYPIINRSRRVLWLVAGSAKARMLARLRAGDVSIPAGRVSRDHAVVLADLAAAGQVGKKSKTEVAWEKAVYLE